ncbi:MAG TPA: anti-sigma factor antagonist [Spirochaetes bacterium]|nr:anti-sigma factor antagonist [Spirochaetota bacterium]
MTINQRVHEDILIFDVTGDISIHHSPKLSQDIIQKMSPDKNKVIVNLKEASYIDSSGIGSLIRILTTLKDLGGTLKLIHISGQILEAFTLTRLINLFQIYNDEKTAIDSFLEIKNKQNI